MLEMFQISLALLVSLTGLTAAIAEGSGISALTLPIALGAWYFVDHKQVVHVPGWLAPLLGLLAFIAAGMEYVGIPEQSYLAVGNHLLAYLTWIMLCQQKRIRQYWTLCALSILQIAVTSLLTYSMWFGIALVIYTLLATWTLSLFLLCRNARSFGELAESGPEINGSDTIHAACAYLNSGVSRDRHERLVTSRFCMNTGAVTGFSLVLATMFFLFIPRIWPSAAVSRLAKGATPLTGFSTEVRLGDMGEILESEERVMEIQIFDARTDQPLNLNAVRNYLGGEPLFRGAVLEEYRQGRWHRSRFKISRSIGAGIPVADYRLRIDLAGLDTEAIFTFGNTVGAATTKSFGVIGWDYFSNEMIRGEETDLSRDFSYDVYTRPGSPDEWLAEQRKLELMSPRESRPHLNNYMPIRPHKYEQSLATLLQLPPELERLFEISRKVTQGASTPREAARKIENWLTNSGEFHYTMNLSVTDSSIDPILDFLENRRTGHCEYFASAMATMLRTIGIPSRVITGFKGAAFNPKTGKYVVRQYHAHAWVEAYLNDRWVTFDPTPPDRDIVVQDIQNRPSRLLMAWRTAESVWHRFSTMSREGQEEKIYQPLKDRISKARQIATELLQGRASGFQRLMAFLTSPRRWLSLEGGIVVVLLILLLLAMFRLLRIVLQTSQTLRDYLKSQGTASGARVPRIPFYDQLISILREHGIVPQPTQTAREFIHSAMPALAPRLVAAGMVEWPEEMVEKFYRVRFGRQALTPEESIELENQLRELEKSLQTAEGP